MSNPIIGTAIYFCQHLPALTWASEPAATGCECQGRDASHRRPALRSAALAVFFFLVRGSRRGGVLGQPVLDLGFDLRQLFRLRLEVAGMGPLELGFERAADAPI